MIAKKVISNKIPTWGCVLTSFEITVIVPFWKIHPVGTFCLARAADSFVNTVPVREAFTFLIGLFFILCSHPVVTISFCDHLSCEDDLFC